MDNAEKYHFDDFTEEQYRQTLRIAKSNWRFVDYTEYESEGQVCLWRHDIDTSVHRALRLAEIEAEERISATYFVLLHSDRYNPLEKEVFNRLIKIRDLGHKIGLHFDMGFYADRLETFEDLQKLLKFEKAFLQDVFQVELSAFSFHNPVMNDALQFDQDIIAGMVNAYGQYIKNNFSYCSDSHCYWRFQRLRDVVTSAQDKRLQVLTHPVCWAPVPMSPRDRFERAVMGRAENTIRRYEAVAKKINRKIIS